MLPAQMPAESIFALQVRVQVRVHICTDNPPFSCFPFLPSATYNRTTHSYDILGCVLQNPVNSLMYEVGMIQVLAPLVSLTIECRSFCKPPLRTKPMLVAILFYLVSSLLLLVLGQGHFGSGVLYPVKLFHFPWQFRYQNYLLLLGTAVAYAIVVMTTRRMLAASDRQRIQPTQK